MFGSKIKGAQSVSVSKKPKKTSTFAIYDALRANQAPQPISSSAHQLTKGLHSNAARWNEVLVPKSFVVKGKRKKKLSTFKKKILLERLRVSIKLRIDALNASGSSVDATIDTAAEIADHVGVPVHIFNFVDDVDLNDETELVEVVANLNELLLPVGEIVRIRILYAQTAATAHAEVTFVDAVTADRAIAVIEGLVCGGQKLTTRLSIAQVSTSCTSPCPPVADTQHTVDNSPFATALYLYNMVSSEALEDPEETHEVLSDVQELCGVFGHVRRVWIEKRKTVLHRPTCNISPHTSSNLPWAVVCFSRVQHCITSAQNAATHTVAECPLATYLFDYDAYKSEHFHPCCLISLEPSEEFTTYFAVRLLGFCSAEEIQNEEECEEVLDNVRCIVGETCEAWTVENVLSVKSSVDETLADVIVFVTSLHSAGVLHAALSCRVMGGQPLQVDILHLSLGDEGAPLPHLGELCRYDAHGAILDMNGSVCAHTARVCGADGAAVLVVQNYFSADDLDECGEDEIAEMKRDLLGLCAHKQRPWQSARTATDEDTDTSQSGASELQPPGFVQRVHIVREVSQFAQVGSTASDPNTEELHLAGAEFELPSLAQEAMLHLDERIIGGAELIARVERCDSTAAAAVIVAELSKGADDNEVLHSPALPTNSFNEELLCLFAEDYLPNESSSSAEGTGPDGIPAGGARVASKYVEAKAAPKLGGHDAPRLPIPVADEATNAAARELLTLISTFQMRLKEKNPLKAKQKLRFVTGLKQCLNSVKAGKARLLLLAPNTEANEVVDDKIDTLISEAQQRAVPVCYCLSKRILGKAAQLSIKQSAVVILDPDGAYEHFKIIIKFVSPNR